MFERFTTAARDVVRQSEQEARQLRHRYVGTEHLLLALLREEAGLAYTVLCQAGVQHDRVRQDVVRIIGAPGRLLTAADAEALQTIGIDLDTVLSRIEETFGPDALENPVPPPRRGLLGRVGPGGTGFTTRAKKVLGLALREAIRLNHNYIGTEHILLGLVREGDGLAARILYESGVRLKDLRTATLTALDEAA